MEIFEGQKAPCRINQIGLVLPAAALLAAVLFLQPAAAQEENALEENLDQELAEEFELIQLEEEEVVFSASLRKQKRQLSPSAITVITRSQIETAGAFSLVDLLRRVPGLEVISVSPGFSSVNARIPTTLENHFFLVLIDGRQTNIWFWGLTAWELQPLTLDDIERIEVIRGPASAVYGSNAVGGVISITTRAVPRSTSASASFQGGRWSRAEASGRIATRLGDFGFSASAGYDYSGEPGFVDLTGKKFAKGRALVEYLADELQLRLDVSGGSGEGMHPTIAGRLAGSQDVVAANFLFDYRSVRARADYTYSHFLTSTPVALELNGLRLAELIGIDAKIHDLNLDAQWTLPELWQPLVLIAGANLRSAWLSCPTCLDGKGFTDPASSRYHLPGVDFRELRAGFFLHAEMEPAKKVQLSASGRADYSSDSGFFFSPRIAAVAEAGEGHFLRLSGARAFRRLTYLERHLHPLVTFPENSPLKGGDQTLFLEFLSRNIGNENLPDETLWTAEAGYEWVPPALAVEAGLCVYFSFYGNQSSVHTEIRTNIQGLPDLRASSARYELDRDVWIAGVEGWAKYSPRDWIALRAAWSYRQVSAWKDTEKEPTSADQIFSLGAEFLHPEGFLGSLYFYGHSDWIDTTIDNPGGILQPTVHQHLPYTMLALARVGFRVKYRQLQTETGLKLMLPIDLESGALRMYEHGGGVTPEGKLFGGTELRPALLFYLNGNL
jgi:outer membrane receptor for ferrienterochelin and colicin